MIFVLPADAIPSGGNVYDRRVLDGLREIGWDVTESAVTGSWPRPSATERAALGRELSAAPDGALVLLDGLVACGVPEIVVPHADRLRLVVLVHLPLADEGGPDLDAREREVLHAARAVVTTSPRAAERVRAHHGLTEVHVVIPGTDVADPAPGTDGVSRLLCVASLTPRKGQDLLVTALAAVADRDWACDCVGPLERDPRYVSRVRELIAAHGLDERIRLTGSRTGQALEHSYARADLVVLPSRSETYGMAVTEALARGIPVLASAAPDALDSAGLCFPPGDVRALTEALRDWFDRPALRAGLRRSALLRRGTLTPWTHTAQRMAQVLANS
ncbi:glycosyltransferase family 4 protein [Amycolatopsis sp. K13G38]|uniref:Glycosyltransferase family 4 protein n=1 Tax=Amycolatopsis acididurans TaxID=2724524 RepID=A0ABX1J4D0_9PSEU|nr:glycosyltransferase family 4 protein [Amycolatopsis acididurans]NKQ54648.1 glycosyltransferase family 4 protein [Amycolatopsis acididurans]